jgi:hypothetical protein
MKMFLLKELGSRIMASNVFFLGNVEEETWVEGLWWTESESNGGVTNNSYLVGLS